MASISELIYHKYRTSAGMSEMRGVIAVCSMINILGSFRRKMFYQLKRERDRLVMANIRRLPICEMSCRDRLIANGVIVPKSNDAA